MFTPDTGQPFIVWHCPWPSSCTSCRGPVSQSQSTYSEPVYLKQHYLDFLPICIAASRHDSVIYMGIWTVRRRHEAHGTLKIRCVIVAMRIACAARGTWQLPHLQRLSFAEQEGQDDIFRIYVWKGHPSERVKCNRRLACFIAAGYYYYFPLDRPTYVNCTLRPNCVRMRVNSAAVFTFSEPFRKEECECVASPSEQTMNDLSSHHRLTKVVSQLLAGTPYTFLSSCLLSLLQDVLCMSVKITEVCTCAP